ncbi:carboxylesterase/lipase family protein [Streptomyces specialis]|uniref:carboxylesterase/lipase family protein n=1 Tax=Streptomyces specialis TaxID=498367 RepID=UPI00073E5BA3|nr:carboxylesterase family protein [Streptomyces specialis]
MPLPAILPRRVRRTLLLLAVAATALAPLPAHAGGADRHGGSSATLVRTDNGWVRGESTDEGRQFLGIPYAQAPTGDLRWRAPRPAQDWRGVRDATEYGDYCAQNTYWAPGFEERHTTEDCLDVNVYTPPTARNAARLPVMVWIHGGGNVGGAGRDIVPDEFARRTGTVVVTLNYRLGAMGFLTLPGTTGNFALLDQQQALRWVRSNIDRFGGDPGRVTIAGESAGGSAVCAQLASPSARGLFRAAIIQSGAFGDCAGRTRDEAEAQSLALAERLGCADPASAAACLRAKPAGEILDAQSRDWRYTVGGRELPLQPAEAFASGRAAPVPVMNGANSDEGLVFAYDTFDRWGRTLTADAYPAAVTAAFGEETAAEVLAAYPLSAYERPAYAYAAAVGDQLFACPALRLDPLLAERGRVYAYEFADRTSPLFASLPDDADFDFGATHAAELNYLFKPYGRAPEFTAEQRALSAQMTAYWGSFVHGSPPRAPRQAAMPEQGAHPGQVLQLRTASAGGNAVTGTLPEAHHCDVWEAAADR